MIKRYISNRALIKEYNSLQNDLSETSEQSHYSLFKAKNKHLFMIEDRTLDDKSGMYRVKMTGAYVGTLKWFVSCTDEHTYLELCDIVLGPKYRNIGIGTYLIQQLEITASKHNCEYITGFLSGVDEATERDTSLRNNFYTRNGYVISNSKVTKHL